MSHVMKALLKIILDRNEKKLEAEISENQSDSDLRKVKEKKKNIHFKDNNTKIHRSTKACIYMLHRL